MRGSTGNNVIWASQAGDQLWGRSGDDTLIGGKAADVFWFGASEGDDLLMNFANSSCADGADSIMLYTAGLAPSAVGIAVSGSNIIFTIGVNTLTVCDGALQSSTSCLLADTGGRICFSDGMRYNIIAANSGYALSRQSNA